MIDRPTNAAEKRRAFRRLHEAGCFDIPDPGDIEGVRFLQSLWFNARGYLPATCRLPLTRGAGPAAFTRGHNCRSSKDALPGRSN